jgi:hypothetical protein
MANYRMIENVEDIGSYRDGDMTVFEPRDVVGKIERQDGRETDSPSFAREDYHANGREYRRLAEAADYNG